VLHCSSRLQRCRSSVAFTKTSAALVSEQLYNALDRTLHSLRKTKCVAGAVRALYAD
jgi:hypothetical protein